MKKSSRTANPEIKGTLTQRVSELPKHQFRWSRGVATCSCGYWTLWGAKSVKGARRDHAYHRRNRFEVESQAVGHLEPDGQGGKSPQDGGPYAGEPAIPSQGRFHLPKRLFTPQNMRFTLKNKNLFELQGDNKF